MLLLKRAPSLLETPKLSQSIPSALLCQGCEFPPLDEVEFRLQAPPPVPLLQHFLFSLALFLSLFELGPVNDCLLSLFSCESCSKSVCCTSSKVFLTWLVAPKASPRKPF